MFDLGDKTTTVALSGINAICFHSLGTHLLRCPAYMIDRNAECIHCRDLGQGVAFLSLLIVLILSL